MEFQTELDVIIPFSVLVWQCRERACYNFSQSMFGHLFFMTYSRELIFNIIKLQILWFLSDPKNVKSITAKLWSATTFRLIVCLVG